jgi:hypothetical protein
MRIMDINLSRFWMRNLSDSTPKSFVKYQLSPPKFSVSSVPGVINKNSHKSTRITL